MLIIDYKLIGFVRVLIQILCSYVTLPLYALVTQVAIKPCFYLLQ